MKLVALSYVSFLFVNCAFAATSNQIPGYDSSKLLKGDSILQVCQDKIDIADDFDLKNIKKSMLSMCEQVRGSGANDQILELTKDVVSILDKVEDGLSDQELADYKTKSKQLANLYNTSVSSQSKEFDFMAKFSKRNSDQENNNFVNEALKLIESTDEGSKALECARRSENGDYKEILYAFKKNIDENSPIPAPVAQVGSSLNIDLNIFKTHHSIIRTEETTGESNENGESKYVIFGNKSISPTSFLSSLVHELHHLCENHVHLENQLDLGGLQGKAIVKAFQFCKVEGIEEMIGKSSGPIDYRSYASMYLSHYTNRGYTDPCVMDLFNQSRLRTKSSNPLVNEIAQINSRFAKHELSRLGDECGAHLRQLAFFKDMVKKEPKACQMIGMSHRYGKTIKLKPQGNSTKEESSLLPTPVPEGRFFGDYENTLREKGLEAFVKSINDLYQFRLDEKYYSDGAFSRDALKILAERGCTI
jgi:hypothetical protein